jgi:oligopeptide/dipeptide ABC transporter ATP-binding protein
VEPDPLLQVRDLTIEYPTDSNGWRPVVEEFNLRIAAAERVGLVGESGSGKSVAALGILGLVREPGRIRRGVVAFSGERIGDERWQQLRGGDIGLVFQEVTSALNPVYSIGYQLSEAVSCHGDLTRDAARTEAERLLTEVGLTDAARIWHAYPHELSGGQLQRIMVALAMAGGPRLLIADEPTSNLDHIHQATILAMLRELHLRRGLGMLLISHDLALVAGAVDRVMVMFDGQIVEEAPVAALFSAPLHPYTRLLLDRAAGVDGSWRPRSHRSTVSTTGCRFSTRCPLVVAECRARAPSLAELADDRSVRCPVSIDGRDPHGVGSEDRDG